MNVTSNGKAVSELTDLLRETFASVEIRIDLAFARGWRPSEEVVRRLASCRRPDGVDPSRWLRELFDQFCNRVVFPQDWTDLDKRALFTDLFMGRRDEAGYRKVM